MINLMFESVLPVLVVLPLMLLFLKDKSQVKTIVLFAVIFILYQLILKAPKEFVSLQVIKGQWNWTGKLLGIIFGFILYSILKDKLKPFDFLQFKQNPKTFFKTMLLAFLMVCTSFFSYFDSVKEFNWETLLYQLSMPGLDEELMFRAILLGLLLTCLRDKIKMGKWTLGNPSILIIGILFGLVHALHFKNNIKFESYIFFCTFLSGYIWSWVTVESKSILLPVISHNLTNFMQNLIRMVK
ncbi:CPBP family intramembrane glutamic endopeptidase [Flavobacterium poyangense]|uniref:CPBP family intramembrane glutamic endopeptidase n=1 Tax=Flavobacterium poyangense TaxID=2204302 RepID=UPI00141FBE9C|nr:CPBP family intramembrane glutamic endopeptidase [Flavobacterium sp. JXAS1]